VVEKIDPTKQAGLDSSIVGIENVKTCLRPCAPDDMPIVGALKKYPDVYVHSGLGGKAANSFACGKLTAEMIVHGEVKTPLQISGDQYEVRRFGI